MAERRFFITYSSLVIAKPYRFRFLVAKVLQVCITEKINYKKKPVPQSFNKISIPWHTWETNLEIGNMYLKPRKMLRRDIMFIWLFDLNPIGKSYNTHYISNYSHIAMILSINRKSFMSYDFLSILCLLNIILKIDIF